MEIEKLAEKLLELGVPVAYYRFTSPQKLPFIAFYEISGTVEGADDINLYRRKNFTIELYTAEKDVQLERKLENLFCNTELERQADTYLEKEDMFMTAYTMEIIQYIDDEEEKQDVS